MKIKEIITRVDKSKQFEDEIYITEIAESMGIYNTQNWETQSRLTSYYIGDWYCTDSRVGYKVYFFDGEPVAVSSQTGRKMTEKIEWISKDSFKKVKDYVLSFSEEPEPVFALCNMNEELGDTYKINYHGQLYDYQKKIALYKGKNVEIIEFHKGKKFNEAGQYEPSLVKIRLEDKTEIWLEIKDLDFPYNITKTI